jgi:hypothetical protein
MRVRPECRSFGQSVPLYDKLPLGCARKTFIRGMHSLSGHRISGCAASSFGRNFGACAVVGAIPQERIPKFAPCNCLQGKDISLASDGSGYRIDHPPDRARMCRVGANRIGDHHEPRRRSRGEVSARSWDRGVSCGARTGAVPGRRRQRAHAMAAPGRILIDNAIGGDAE